MRAMLSFGILILFLIPREGGAREVWGQQPRARLSLVPQATGGATPALELSRALLVTADNGMEVSTEADEMMVPRVLLEGLMGGLFGLGGTISGGILGIAAGAIGGASGDALMLPLVAGMVGGYLLMAPLGVYIGGKLVKGEGLFLPTLVGSAVGAGVTGLCLAVTGTLSRDVAVMVMLPAVIVGGMLGFEFSHSFVLQEKRKAASGVQVLPSAGVSSSGTGLFGLAGRF